MVHKLRLFRQQQKISAATLGSSVGATKASICRIEQGKQTPSLDLMFRLVDATNGAVQPNDFLLISREIAAE